MNSFEMLLFQVSLTDALGELPEIITAYPEANMEYQKIVSELKAVKEEMETKNMAAAKALTQICELLNVPDWEYPGQVVRDVQTVVQASKNVSEIHSSGQKEGETFMAFFHRLDVALIRLESALELAEKKEG